MKLQIMICLFSNLLFFGCDKGPDLTPITQEGKNTFSCKVNGKVWVPDATGSIFVTVKPINGGFLRNLISNSLNIEIITFKKNGDQMEVYLKSPIVGIHNIESSTKRRGEAFNPENYGWFHSSENKNYMTSNIQTGRVTLTKADTISGVISGTFDFVAATSSGEIVKVSEGRFDIKSPQ
jgi:hypothetical protein